MSLPHGMFHQFEMGTHAPGAVIPQHTQTGPLAAPCLEASHTPVDRESSLMDKHGVNGQEVGSLMLSSLVGNQQVRQPLVSVLVTLFTVPR